MGGSPTTETSTSESSLNTFRPWEGAAPGYGFLGGQIPFQMRPTPFFPGQTYVGPSDATQQGAQGMMDAAKGMRPLLDTMQSNYGFLSNAADVANNPYVQSMNKTMQQQVNQNLNRNLLPQIQSGAQSVNALGSDRMGLAQGQALADTSQALANQVSQNNLTAYGQGLGAQQNALSQTGNMLTNMMAPSQAMLGAGQIGEGYQQKALQDAMARFAYQYQEPRSRIGNMSQLLQFLQPLGTQYGQGFGTGTQPNPGYMSPLQMGLGLAGTLGGAALAGPFGAAIGGGLAGGMGSSGLGSMGRSALG